MNGYIKFGRAGEQKFYYRRFAIDILNPSDLDDGIRCPHCGKQQLESEIIAGWHQYGFPGTDSYDEYTVLGDCLECKKKYAYVARVWTTG